MIDYNETKMYMFRHKGDIQNNNIYIGYTTDWDKRLIAHRCKYNKYNEYLLYQYIRQNGGWDEWEMKWIEDYPCVSKHEAMLRERELMCEYNSTLNVCKNQIMTDDERKEYMKNYERDKDKKAIMDKAYRQTEKGQAIRKIIATCECGFVGLKENFSRHRKSKKHIDIMNKFVLFSALKNKN